MLFEIIIEMIKHDKNRLILLQTIHFEFVSSSLLKKFFEIIRNDEIDIEIFESLKKRLIEDYSNQSKLSKRWKSKPTHLSEGETEELFQLLNSFSEDESNPLEKTKLLIEQNTSLQNKIQQLEKEIERLKSPLPKCKINSPIDHNGIIQNLKKVEADPVSVSCSSSLTQPENVLSYDDSRWVSRDQSNSWISLGFNSKKILLSGYMFRSYQKLYYHTPINWILEGSNDKANWILIDKQSNCNWATENFSEAYFPCESKETYKYFKFTQTGKNCFNHDYFQLNYLELFGKTFDQ